MFEVSHVRCDSIVDGENSLLGDRIDLAYDCFNGAINSTLRFLEGRFQVGIVHSRRVGCTIARKPGNKTE